MTSGRSNGYATSLCVLLLAAASHLLRPVESLDDGLAQTPPMGWRSWNAYGGDVRDTLILSVADALKRRTRLADGVPTSFADLGYYRLGIDDGWQACGEGPRQAYHGTDGTPLVNNTRFRDLKALVDYGHEAGLLMDFYQINCMCMDTYILNVNRTWARQAWKGNVIQLRDAGFDGVKIDNCGDDDGQGYAIMMDEIKKTGKPILVENCNQAHGKGPPRGLPTNSSDWCNMHMFRSGGDIRSNFDDTMNKLQRTIPFQDINQPISRPGCWAFPDMLEVGNFGANELATIESRTHFFAWCIVSSPLFISFDVTNDETVDRIWPIISNREAISINQEWAGHPGRLALTDGDGQIWTKKLFDGMAVLFLNRGEEPIDLSITFEAIGIATGQYRMRDIGLRTTLDRTVEDAISVSNLGKHDSWFLKLTPLMPLRAYGDDHDDGSLQRTEKT
mmetsp:Transcript_17470/g.37878  ORF Transcript_17470/g.37878 Transcript_17470/m.37878 type:complete len:447 (+) Transcript_17470:3-1343(+)